MNRRAFLFGLGLSTFALACKKEPRCSHCGMKIDPASTWQTKLVDDAGTTTSFDTPRCALTAWRSGKTPAKGIRVQDYYDRVWREGTEVRFVLGGDVVGPMGPDLVPVDTSRVTKFIQDHNADRALALDEVTLEILGKMK